MKIGILNLMIHSFPFFSNLANFLSQNGDDVFLIDIELYQKNLFKKYFPKSKVNFLDYEKKNSFKKKYDEKSKIINLNYQVYKINKKKIIKNLNYEYSKAYNFFKKNKFDCCLIFNGENSVETSILKRFKIKTYFFENGYFPNTIQMNLEGVNAKAHFSSFSFNKILNMKIKKRKKINELFLIKKIKINLFIYFLYRIFEKKQKYKFLSQVFSFFKTKFSAFLYKLQKEDKLKFSKNFLFYPLQVNTDSQILINSNFKGIEETITKLKTYFPNKNFVLKTHPAERDFINYKKFHSKRIQIVKKVELNKLLKLSEMVICINSSVGLQALEKRKKILLLGNSFYKSCQSVKVVKNIKNIKKDYNDIKKKKLDLKKIKKYVDKFKNQIFIEGHFLNFNHQTLDEVSKRIVK